MWHPLQACLHSQDWLCDSMLLTGAHVCDDAGGDKDHSDVHAQRPCTATQRHRGIQDAGGLPW